MNRRKLLIALLSAAALSVGLGSGIVPASAQQYRITVRLLTGATQTLTIEAAGCPTSIDLGPVIACEPVGAEPAPPPPAQAPSQAPTTTPASPDDTPDDEPSPSSKPDRQPTTGKKKGDRDRAGKDRGGEGSSRDSDSTPGGGAGDRRDGRDRPDTNPDGSPSLSNPTVTLAEPGPAAIGVPNFVIDRFKIPPFLLPIYKAAEAQYNISWQILAAVNEIETNYGTNLNVSSAGAVGWMQFLPSTWKIYGTDANGDGRADPYNPVDAIFSAARYIKAAGGEKDIRKGLFAYNPANWYVDSVLLRAKVIGGLPEALVGSLTQLVEGRFPVAARARYSDQLSERAYNRRVARTQNASIPVNSKADRTSIDIFSRAGAPVIAVNDGKIIKVGKSRKLGRFLILEDYAGNRYTYAQLGEVAPTYPAPKEQNVTQDQINDELGLPKDPKPTTPASGGSQGNTNTGRPGANGKPAKRSTPAPRTAATPTPPVTKERLFANPTRPSAYVNGGREQIAATTGARDFETYGAYFAKVYGLNRKDVVFKPLVKGSEVVAGTVLGRMGRPEDDKAPYVTFGIKPAGKGAPRIDPKPILDGWKLLESTAIYRAQGKNPFITKSPSVGQMLLMTKEELGKSVLADPRIDIYECGRQDIRNRIIDKRVLIVLKYLAGSGLRPTVSSLKCGHSKYVAGSSRISDHWYGRAVDIAAINGIPMLGNQEDGGITDIAIRRLLQLKGTMQPYQIISLRKYQGFDNTLAMSDHDDHIHIAFPAVPGQGSPQENAALKPRQWFKLIDRLEQIDNPSVPIKPSKYALPRRDPTGRQPGD